MEAHRYLQKEAGERGVHLQTFFYRARIYSVYQNPSIHALYREEQPAWQQFVWNQVCVSIFQDCTKVYAHQHRNQASSRDGVQGHSPGEAGEDPGSNPQEGFPYAGRVKFMAIAAFLWAKWGISGMQKRKASVPLREQRAEQLKILVSNLHLGTYSLSSPCSPSPLLPHSFLILQLFTTRPFSWLTFQTHW